MGLDSHSPLCSRKTQCGPGLSNNCVVAGGAEQDESAAGAAQPAEQPAAAASQEDHAAALSQPDQPPAAAATAAAGGQNGVPRQVSSSDVPVALASDLQQPSHRGDTISTSPCEDSKTGLRQPAQQAQPDAELAISDVDLTQDQVSRAAWGGPVSGPCVWLCAATQSLVQPRC